jgi:uncharacterized protein YjiS (DUF1127 family)
MEATMSISTDAARFHPRRSARWNELTRVIGEWWQHLRSRRELESLDDALLRDIGLVPGEGPLEASRPRWMN